MIFLYCASSFEMKEKIYCFVNFVTAKYGTFCIIIRRMIAYHGISSVSNEIFIIIISVWDIKYSIIGKLLSNYDTKSSMFGYTAR
jgi:hypothetical protein